MTRWTLYTLFRLCFLVLHTLVAPLLPLFAVQRSGPIMNKNGIGQGSYLPDWLWWFSTNDDNPLEGDEGWQTIHCQNFNSYWGKVKWLYRNPAYGLLWHPLGAPIEQNKIVHVYGERKIEQSRGQIGSNKYTMGSYFQYKLIKPLWGDKALMVQTGWILDAYAFGQTVTEPNAIFQFEVRIVKIAGL